MIRSLLPRPVPGLLMAVALTAFPLLFPPAPLRAEVRVATIFGDRMVLQQGQPVPVWGKAAPEEKVTVSVRKIKSEKQDCACELEEHKSKPWFLAAGVKRWILESTEVARAETVAGADGRWRITLPALATGPYDHFQMAVRGEPPGGAAASELLFHDVLVGDVWFFSGQSNMVWTVQNTDKAAFEATRREDEDAGDLKSGYPVKPDGTVDTEAPFFHDPGLRLFQVRQNPGLDPSDDLNVGQWVYSSEKAVGNFSAFAYYFGRELRLWKDRRMAVGLVSSPVGGTRAEAWCTLNSLKAIPSLGYYVDRYHKTKADFPQASEAFKEQDAAYKKEFALWNKEVAVPYNEELKAWQAAVKAVQEVNASKEANATKTAQSTPEAGFALQLQPEPPRPKTSLPAPKAPTPPWGGPDTPSVLFNGCVAPVIPFAIKGAVWYQGESSAQDGNSTALYLDLLRALIGGWRTAWGQGDFPVILVQLPRFGYGWNWPAIREAQRLAPHFIPNTATTYTLDVGDPKDVHYAGKLPPAQRAALTARHLAYKDFNDPRSPQPEWQGPEPQIIMLSNTIAKKFSPNPKSTHYTDPRPEKISNIIERQYFEIVPDKPAIRIYFQNVGDGLKIGTAPWIAKGDKPVPSDSLKAFTIAGADRKFHPATAIIEPAPDQNGKKAQGAGHQGSHTVIVSSPEVPDPVAVRYAWEDCPDANLYNSSREYREADPKTGHRKVKRIIELPTTPFRTDDWPIPLPSLPDGKPAPTPTLTPPPKPSTQTATQGV